MSFSPTWSRRAFLERSALLATGTLLAGCAASSGARRPAERLLYVGTYGPAEQDNLWLYRLNTTTGELTRVAGFRGGFKPGFLTFAPDLRHLYAVNASLEFQGRASGSIRAFAIDQPSGGLTLLNEQPSEGAGPCYLSPAPNGPGVVVANYFGGTVALLPTRPDGTLAPASFVEQHQGAGPHKNQDKAHAHCIVPMAPFALAVDLGTDQVLAYPAAPAAPDTPPRLGAPHVAFQARPGVGPRHLAFHPQSRWAYLINELNSTLTALIYDQAAGTFQEIHTVSALPAGYAGPNSSADVHVSADGRFVYGSNRGHDSIGVFAVDERTGRLTLVEHVSTQGKTPRNFTVLDDLLLVANQNSDSIVSFHRNRRSGRLRPTGFTATVPAPVCLLPLPREQAPGTGR